MLKGKSLKENYPEVAVEWHPTKNGELTPEAVTIASNRKVWWYLPYDDPETGKRFDFEWKAIIENRTLGKLGCPYLTNQKIWPGYNDLATKFPEVAAEWHPTKNGELVPEKVAPASRKKVWWYLPYDDPVTGKHFDFEWEAVIKNRTLRKQGCPYLTNQKIWPGYNDLATKFPEVAAEWHPTKNGGLVPEKEAPSSKKKVWWYLSYDDPETRKHFEFEWEAKIADRVYKKAGCPYLTNKKVWPGYNDLATKFPEIAGQWHPTKNLGVTPDKVIAGGAKWAWWTMPYDDKETGKHFDFEWHARVVDRINNPECPFLTNKKVWPGYNDLATGYPEIAKEWHPSLNRTTPDKVMRYSHVYAWWRCKHGHVWRAEISARTFYGKGCPECHKIRRRHGI